MLHEGAAYAMNERVVPPPSQAQWRAAIRGSAPPVSPRVTAWQDAWVTPATQQAYRSLAESGELTARVVGAPWWDQHWWPRADR